MHLNKWNASIICAKQFRSQLSEVHGSWQYCLFNGIFKEWFTISFPLKVTSSCTLDLDFSEFFLKHENIIWATVVNFSWRLFLPRGTSLFRLSREILWSISTNTFENDYTIQHFLFKPQFSLWNGVAHLCKIHKNL